MDQRRDRGRGVRDAALPERGARAPARLLAASAKDTRHHRRRREAHAHVRRHESDGAAADLRQAGWAVEVFPEAKKMGKQLKYADVRGFQYALIAGGDELERNVCQIKNLQTGESIEYPLSSVATDMK